MAQKDRFDSPRDPISMAKVTQPMSSARMLKVFSTLVAGVMSPKPTVDRTVMDQ